jgi:GrpB-like predicted nucleotidyltransferase (UPF0157 family)
MKSSLSITIPPGAALKQNLAAQHSCDREAYTAAKSAYVNAVMAKASAAA